MPIVWRDAMEVGDPMIDNDHRRLIDLINAVEVTLAADGRHAELAATLEQLGDYTHGHFEREEHLMRLLGYAALAHHRQAHRDLRSRLAALRRQIEAAKAQRPTDDEAQRLIELLRAWLLDHVLKEDMLLKPHLKSSS